jgi:hypothetical protein
VLVTLPRRLFGEDGGFQFLDPRGVLVELRLNDLVEAAIDGREAFVHLFAEAADLNPHVADLVVHLGTESADLVAHVGADVLAFFFNEARKFLEFGFLFCHAGQYTMPTPLTGVRLGGRAFGFAKWHGMFQASNMQRGT